MPPPGTTEAAGPSEDEGPVDVLARINERECAIERLLRDAHEAAATTIAAAHRAAAVLIAARREKADLVAAQACEEVVGLARREAEAIREAAAREAAAILETPRERIDLAADRLLAIVLPGPPDAGRVP